MADAVRRYQAELAVRNERDKAATERVIAKLHDELGAGVGVASTVRRKTRVEDTLVRVLPFFSLFLTHACVSPHVSWMFRFLLLGPKHCIPNHNSCCRCIGSSFAMYFSCAICRPN
jgi:hypothetical protein